jgi:YidC/Oxa1 family membrane protein insertase
MEKRLFLAIFLSLLVVFGFQTLFGTKSAPLKDTQTVEINAFKVQGTPPAIVQAPAAPAPSPNKTSVFIEKDLSLETSLFVVKVTNKGGNIDSIRLKDYDYLCPVKAVLNFDVFENSEFKMELVGKEKVKLVHKSPDWDVTKEFTLNQDHTITAAITIKNASTIAKSFAGKRSDFVVDTARLDTHNVQSDFMLYEYSVKTDKRMIRKDNARAFTDKWNKEEISKVEWAAFRDKYFVTLVQPKEAEENYLIKTISDKELLMGSTLKSIVIDPGASVIYHYKIYAGPQRLDFLNKADKAFSSVMVFSNWGWLDAISKGIYWLLGMIHKFIPNWGLCIIVISLFVYGLMYPLTAKSLVSMKKLQTLQPKMKELQEKYKSNPERLNKEIVELYRVHQVNPLSGCLPMLLQMPIFVGLYQVLWRSVYFRGQSFLWMKDLSLPDQTLKLPFTIPFLGEYLNILPIVMVGVMALQQNLNMKTMVAANPEQAAQQKMMAVFFPILIGFIFYNMASGLNLYFVVFYILSTLSQWHISRNTQAAS